MSHEHDRLPHSVDRIERHLRHDPNNFHNVYNELEHLRRADQEHFRQNLDAVNERLHKDGLLPNLQITSDDNGLLVAKKSNNPKHEAVVGREHDHQHEHGHHHRHHHRHGHGGGHGSQGGHESAHDAGDERIDPNRADATLAQGGRRELIDRALQMAGVPVNAANERAVQAIVQHESGWNANAINMTDRNARAGHPSQGLMQTIPGTFQQYAIAGHNTDITDPLSNLIAGIRYSVARYGSLENVPGVRALAQGRQYVGY